MTLSDSWLFPLKSSSFLSSERCIGIRKLSSESYAMDMDIPPNIFEKFVFQIFFPKIIFSKKIPKIFLRKRLFPNIFFRISFSKNIYFQIFLNFPKILNFFIFQYFVLLSVLTMVHAESQFNKMHLIRSAIILPISLAHSRVSSNTKNPDSSSISDDGREGNTRESWKLF